MSAFFKTLFGDRYNLLFVCFAVGAAALLIRTGLARETVYIVPILLLAGAAGLATR